MRTLNKKIVRLPQWFREALNRRLRDSNQSDADLAKEFNNAQGVVDALISARGSLLDQWDIAEWRHGGYLDWLEDQAFEQHAQKSLNEAAASSLACHMIALLTARYTSALLAYNCEGGKALRERVAVLEHALKLAYTARRAEEKAARVESSAPRPPAPPAAGPSAVAAESANSSAAAKTASLDSASPALHKVAPVLSSAPKSPSPALPIVPSSKTPSAPPHNSPSSNPSPSTAPSFHPASSPNARPVAPTAQSQKPPSHQATNSAKEPFAADSKSLVNQHSFKT